MADLEQELRDCLRRHAADASVAPNLPADVRTRSRQLARRTHATVALAMVPAAAGVAAGSLALTKADSAGTQAKVRTIGTSSADAFHCPRGNWPDLHQLDLDTRLARKPIGEPTFIRRYVHQHPGTKTLTPTHKVIVDDRRLSKRSLAMAIVQADGAHVWKVLIAPAHRRYDWWVYNAARHGCIAVREGAGIQHGS